VNQLTDRPAIRLDAVAKHFSLWKRGAKGSWWRRERDTKVALKPLDLLERESVRQREPHAIVIRGH
jgi:hypothetical protein